MNTNESEKLDNFSVEVDFESLEINDGVEDVTVQSYVHHGRPYVEIEVRMNEYYDEHGAIKQTPPAHDPVSETIQKHGLEIVGIRPTTKSTSRMAIVCHDPDDDVEVDQ